MDGLAMVTVTPGMTPALTSETFPSIAPVVAPADWASAGPEIIATNPTITDRMRSRLMVVPLIYWRYRAFNSRIRREHPRMIRWNMGDTLHRRNAGCNRVLRFLGARACRSAARQIPGSSCSRTAEGEVDPVRLVTDRE